MRFNFEPFTLDTDRRELRRDMALVPVEPQVFDLIVLLVANRDRVVSRDELLTAVWGGRLVSESTIAARINAARRALDDSGEAQRLVRTVRSRGFRFVGDAAVERAVRRDEPEVSVPTIAVMMFRNLSGDPMLDCRAAGLTEDLIDALSRVPGLLVSTSAVTMAPAEALSGVRYVLTGSIQQSGRFLRLTARLVDCAAGSSIWSDRRDCPGMEMFAEQDDFVRTVLVGVCSKLTCGDHARVEGRGTRSLSAWLLYGQAFEEWCRFERVTNFRARELFRRAHEADPQWPSPLAGLSSTFREAAVRGWGASREGDLDQAVTLAEAAVAIDPDDPTGQTHLGSILVEMGRLDEGVAVSERAAELAPGDFYVLGDLAQALPRVGEEQRALAMFARAKKACPVSFGPALVNQAFVLHLVGRRDEAIESLHESLGCSDMPDAHVRLAAAYFEGDRREEAQAEIGKVLTLAPGATVEEFTRNLPFSDRQQRTWYRDLLRGVGLPAQNT